LIKFNKIEKRDLPNHGQTCGHRFADVISRKPNPTLNRHVKQNGCCTVPFHPHHSHQKPKSACRENDERERESLLQDSHKEVVPTDESSSLHAGKPV